MRRILLIFRNDLKRRLKSPLAILVLMITPLIMTGIIGSVFSPGSDQNELPRIKVLIADKDKNIGSQMFLGSFSSPEIKDMFDISMVGEEDGMKLISKGKASALVIIPENFSEKLIKAEKTDLTVIKNPAEQFLPNIVEEFMNTYAVIISGLVLAFEPEIKEIDRTLNKEIEDVNIQDMVPFMERGRAKIESLAKYLDPLLIKLNSEVTGRTEEEKGTALNLFSHILPGMTIMFLFFIIEIFIREILSEREDGKLQRMMFSPLKTGEIIMARILSGWFMGTAVLILTVAAGSMVFNIKWGSYLSLFLLSAVTCFCIASLFSLLNSFFKNRNQAGAFSAPIILGFSAFGGSILPVNNLPSGVQIFSRITPNYWFIQGSLKIKDGIFPSDSIFILMAAGILLFISASVMLKKRIKL